MSIVHLVNIIPGSARADIKHAPLGIVYVGTALQRNGYDVKIHQILPEQIDSIVERILQDSPLFVGFSVLTGLPSYYAAVMSKTLKSRDPTIRIVWGGWHASLTPEQCLAQDYVDVVCIGEGEDAAVEIAHAFESNKPMDSIASVGFKTNGRTVLTDERVVERNIDRYDMDYGTVDMKQFIVASGDRRTIGFYSSRGCPFNCAFCCTPGLSKRLWRYHSAQYVVEHIVALKDAFGVNDVYFSDDNFFINRERAFAIIEGLRSAGISCSTFDVRVDFINRPTLERLVRSGATGLFFGWESGSDRLLKLMHKGITSEEIVSCVKLLSEYPDIAVWGSGIICLPTETRSEYETTVKLALKLSGMIPKGTISLFQYMPLPATEFLSLAVTEGFKMPENPTDWVRSDPQGTFYEPTWVPWLNDYSRGKHDIKMTQEYMRHVLRKTGKDANMVFNVIQGAFNRIASYRVGNQNFLLPVDYDLYQLFMRSWEFARQHFKP